MQIVCPHCNSVLNQRYFSCPKCGHQWQIKCGACGKVNPPIAVFCGQCGRGLSWKTRLEKRIRDIVPFATHLHIKELATGFIFGTILFVFAFGTMGMRNPDFSHPQPAINMAPSVNPFTTEAGKKFFIALQKTKKDNNTARQATHADLVRIGNLIVETFSPAIDPEGKNINRQAIADSLRYLVSLAESEDDLSDIPLKRSDTALFLYRLISDLFDIQNYDNPNYKYADLPRYHFLNLPVEVLEAMGIKLARDQHFFGPDDVVSFEWLSNVSINVVNICEQKIKSFTTALSQ